MSPLKRKTIAIAGASGYIGKHVVEQLASTYDIVGLGRSKKGPPGFSYQWRQVDLLYYNQVEQALGGCDALLYLVHSMAPSKTISQAHFSDIDLLCADNVGRAAKACGLGYIVYLGGLIPPEGVLSYHLRSRKEVESALSDYGVPVTTLRAGLIVGPHGSSTEILLRLVMALPVMLVPAWGRVKTQPITLAETVDLLTFALANPQLAGKNYDIGGDEIVTIVHLLQQTAAIVGKRRWILSVPIRTLRLSLLWVSVITGMPHQLVLPLLASLNHEMVTRDGRIFQQLANAPHKPLQDALQQAFLASDWQQLPGRWQRFYRFLRKIFSIQIWSSGKAVHHQITFLHRFPWNPSWPAQDAAKDYLQALPRIVWPWVKVTYPNAISFRFYFGPWVLLAFQRRLRQSSLTKEVYTITGGLLAAQQTIRMGRLEFRLMLGQKQLMIAILDYIPRLPWWIYRFTQHFAHGLVMRCFTRMVQKKVSRFSSKFC